MYRVILVDDEHYSLLDLLHSMDWERFQFEVIAKFTNPIEALDAILKAKPDVVFSDIRMPRMSGLQLIEEIKKELPNCFCVLVSGYADFEYAQKAISLGVTEYCLKPLGDDSNKLLQKLKRILNDKFPHADTPPASSFQNHKMRKKTEDFILLNLHRQITLSDLSQELNMSVPACCQFFKDEFDSTFLSYLICKRMDYAKVLLQNPSLSIKDIAVKSGYNDYFYFCKAFTKFHRLSPAKYRKGYGDANVHEN